MLVEAVAEELPFEGTPLIARRGLGEASAVYYECPFGLVPPQNVRVFPDHVDELRGELLRPAWAGLRLAA